MTDLTKVVAGHSLQSTVQIKSDNPLFYLPSKDKQPIPFDSSLLSKHILLLGGIGTGKTNVFNHFVRNIRHTMTDNDIMVIFDAKGDYVHQFYQPGDIVVSNDNTSTDYWNIFNEILIDDRVEENILEISNFMFKNKIERSSNPFFPSAARDLFSALLTSLIRAGNQSLLNNATIRNTIDRYSSEKFIKLLEKHSDLKGISSYISKEAAGQAQGVASELQQTIRELFIGNFKKIGNFSIRSEIRKKGSRIIFIEYDLGIGKTLAPIYSLLIDLAIKEALCRKENEGNVYFILDEFRLLSVLEHMDNGINFGRSLGAKFILGLQNVDQIYDVYGTLAAKSILSGCSTLISFFVLDDSSRKLIKERAGANVKILSYMSTIQSKGVNEQIKDGNVIEDWDISTLKVGAAIIQSLNNQPFIFNFREFK